MQVWFIPNQSSWRLSFNPRLLLVCLCCISILDIIAKKHPPAFVCGRMSLMYNIIQFYLQALSRLRR